LIDAHYLDSRSVSTGWLRLRAGFRHTRHADIAIQSGAPGAHVRRGAGIGPAPFNRSKSMSSNLRLIGLYGAALGASVAMSLTWVL